MKARKEATVAVIIGLFLGLLVIGGVYRARTAIEAMKKKTVADTSNNQSAPTTETIPAGLFLTIETPDNSVSKDALLTLSGKTTAGTYIAITGENNDYLIVPNELGSFSQDISLVKGANTIKVTVYDKSGAHVEKTLNVVYTTAEI